MAEYIRREDALKVVEDVKNDEATRKYGGSLSMIADSIDGLPAADVVERKTGKWISHIEDGYLECPFCGAATNCDGDESELHFCFSCGAKMEGVRNDE